VTWFDFVLTALALYGCYKLMLDIVDTLWPVR
jgi:hypothetical protein